MRVFQAEIFDQTLDSTPLYVDSAYNSLLGSMEELSIFAVADVLSGTAPTLTVQIEESPNQIHWINKQVSPEINAAALSLTSTTTAQGRDLGSLPSSGFIRLRVQLGGTTPRARVRLWVTVRVEQIN